MRRAFVFCLVAAGLLMALAGAPRVEAEPANPRLPVHVRAALVVDVDKNEVLYSYAAHEKADPASLVKMMSVLLAMERVERGELSLNDKYKVSSKASKIGGHQVYLKQGEVFPLRDLLKAVVIASANDAAYAVSEHVAGSPERFVALMNERARQLGMHDTRFTNPHGLPPDRRKGQEANRTSAHDLALLARALMKYPEVRQWASTRTDSLRNGKFLLTNTNRSFLQRFEGADGFKTGYHPRGAGFSVVATATREGRKLLAVVLGAQNARARLQASTQLLEWGFDGRLHTIARLDTAPEAVALNDAE